MTYKNSMIKSSNLAINKSYVNFCLFCEIDLACNDRGCLI